jgi:predicted nucleic acid-binding protein
LPYVGFIEQRSKQMTQALQNFAKTLNVSEQDAYTFARLVKYQMDTRNLSMEDAVHAHMASMKELARLTREDEDFRRETLGQVWEAARGRK